MPEETIELTKRALHRLKVVEAVTDRRLTPAEAGWQLGLTTRQVKAWWRPTVRKGPRAWSPAASGNRRTDG